MEAIDPTLPLEPRLVAAVEILRRRVADILQLRTEIVSLLLDGIRAAQPTDESA